MTRRREHVLSVALGMSLLLTASRCAESVPLPERFEGTYVTRDARYAGRYFRLTPSEVTLGVEDEQEEGHAIQAVYTKMKDGERVYEATNLRVGLFPEGEKASA